MSRDMTHLTHTFTKVKYRKHLIDKHVVHILASGCIFMYVYLVSMLEDLSQNDEN